MDCGCVCVWMCVYMYTWMYGHVIGLLWLHNVMSPLSCSRSFDHLFFITWSFVSLGLRRRATERECTLCSKRLFAVAA